MVPTEYNPSCRSLPVPGQPAGQCRQPTPPSRGRQARGAPQVLSPTKLLHRLSFTASSTGWKSTSGRTGHSTAHGHEKVGGWLCNIQGAYESDWPSSYPTLPAAPHKDQHFSDSDSEYGSQRRRRRRLPAVTRIKNAELYVHKDYEGLLQLCNYATRLQEGGPHDGYACFIMLDILWARRVRFHLERMRNL